MADEITRYGPFALAMVAVSLLVAKYPSFLGLSPERVRSSLLMYNAAFVLFVVLDLVSGRALTTFTDLPKTGLVILTAVLVLALANALYLIVRPRAPR